MQSMKNGKIIIYTDGGARGNPGPAGVGVIILDESGRLLKEVSKSLGVKTNNWAEYEAIILGLETAKKLFGKEKIKKYDVEVRTDSEFVARQLQGEYKIKEESLFPQFIKIWNMRISDFPSITFRHIPREKNKEADRLANEAMDEQKISQSKLGL